jgi:hypothetical protein
MCDEFIEIAELQRASKLLKDSKYQVYGRRIDWFYGVQASKQTCLLPKGFRRTEATYNATNFHDTLHYTNPSENRIILDVQHLHVFSMKDDYGKFGYYIYHEVKQLRNTKTPKKSLFIRFLKLLRALQLNSIRFKNKPSIIFFLLAQFFATIFLFAMAIIEQKMLKSKDEQIKLYTEKYH